MPARPRSRWRPRLPSCAVRNGSTSRTMRSQRPLPHGTAALEGLDSASSAFEWVADGLDLSTLGNTRPAPFPARAGVLFRLLPRWRLAGPAPLRSGRRACRARVLADPIELGPRGVKVALGTLRAAAQFAARLLEHLGA